MLGLAVVGQAEKKRQESYQIVKCEVEGSLPATRYMTARKRSEPLKASGEQLIFEQRLAPWRGRKSL
jgi:hypothetical protein